MSEREIIVRHKGVTYDVVLDVEAQWEDDSFDHEFGTEECGHWEIDWDATSIISVTDPEGDEIDSDAVPGLNKAIKEQAEGMDLSDWDE